LFAASRYHAVFTDSPLSMLGPGTNHRTHAVMEQVHADLRSGQLAHLPSGSFAANGAWSVLAAMAFNLTRAAGALASLFHAKPTTTTIRDQLIRATCAAAPRSSETMSPPKPSRSRARSTWCSHWG